MTLVLNGTTGVSAVDGSASTPAIQGNDTNTGVFFPAADTVAVATGGSERMRVDSSGNVGIGTSSPNFGANSVALAVNGSSSAALNLKVADVGAFTVSSGSGYTALADGRASTTMQFSLGGTERARIDSSGYLLVGTTSYTYGYNGGYATAITPGGVNLSIATTANANAIIFNNPNGQVGYINTSGTSTIYSTASDYRLKTNVQPMLGALGKVMALRPVTYDWRTDGTPGQGFIAHELQAVVPDCVSGEKDAVDADGNPVYQGIDTSFLVATLTAAIQELNAKVESLTAEIATLKGAQA